MVSPVGFGSIFVGVIIFIIWQIIWVSSVVLWNINKIFIIKSKPRKTRRAETLTCPPAARCAKINASLPGGRTPPTPLTRPIICLLFLPRFEGVGITTAGTAISSFLSVLTNKSEKKQHLSDLINTTEFLVILGPFPTGACIRIVNLCVTCIWGVHCRHYHGGGGGMPSYKWLCGGSGDQSTLGGGDYQSR